MYEWLKWWAEEISLAKRIAPRDTSRKNDEKNCLKKNKEAKRRLDSTFGVTEKWPLKRDWVLPATVTWRAAKRRRVKEQKASAKRTFEKCLNDVNKSKKIYFNKGVSNSYSRSTKETATLTNLFQGIHSQGSIATHRSFYGLEHCKQLGTAYRVKRSEGPMEVSILSIGHSAEDWRYDSGDTGHLCTWGRYHPLPLLKTSRFPKSHHRPRIC